MRVIVLAILFRAYLCDSGKGNMPGHVGSPGQIDPKKLWDILSFDLQMNSSLW